MYPRRRGLLALGTVVTQSNFEGLARKLFGECAYGNGPLHCKTSLSVSFPNVCTPILVQHQLVTILYDIPYVGSSVERSATRTVVCTGNLNFDFSAALCDALDQCYSLWYTKFKGKTPPPGM